MITKLYVSYQTNKWNNKYNTQDFTEPRNVGIIKQILQDNKRRIIDARL